MSNRGWMAAVLLCGGCAGGMFGTGIGDAKVSDLEAAAMNAGGYAAGVSGVGDMAQKFLGSPSKVRAAPSFPLLGLTTNHWDSKGTVTHPPYFFRVDPDYGSITGTYGAVSAPAQPTIDPAIMAIIQKAIADALQGDPARPPAAPSSVPAPAAPVTPDDVGALLEAIGGAGK